MQAAARPATAAEDEMSQSQPGRPLRPQGEQRRCVTGRTVPLAVRPELGLRCAVEPFCRLERPHRFRPGVEADRSAQSQPPDDAAESPSSAGQPWDPLRLGVQRCRQCGGQRGVHWLAGRLFDPVFDQRADHLDLANTAADRHRRARRPMFFSSHGAEENRRLLWAAGFALVLDEVVSMQEPEGEVSFLWVIAEKR